MCNRMNHRVSFFGDAFLDQVINVKLDPAEIGDLVVINLEAPITDSSSPVPGKIHLKTSECFLRRTFPGLPLLASVANNHIMDYGEQGLADTLQELQQDSIEVCGAGSEADNFQNPRIMAVGPHLVAFLSYCGPTGQAQIPGAVTGVAPLDFERVRRDVEQARDNNATHIVVAIHWGVEEISLPRPRDVEMSQKIVSLGVDLIIGHHSHCIQSFGRFEDVTVCFGLGNFFFPDLDITYRSSQGEPMRYRKKQRSWNDASMWVSFNLDRREASLRKIYRRGETVVASGKSCQRYFRDFNQRPLLPAEFQRAVAVGRARAAIASYVARPKLPRLRHAQTLFKLFSGRNRYCER